MPRSYNGSASAPPSAGVVEKLVRPPSGALTLIKLPTVHRPFAIFAVDA